MGGGTIFWKLSSLRNELHTYIQRDYNNKFQELITSDGFPLLDSSKQFNFL